MVGVSRSVPCCCLQLPAAAEAVLLDILIPWDLADMKLSGCDIKVTLDRHHVLNTNREEGKEDELEKVSVSTAGKTKEISA